MDLAKVMLRAEEWALDSGMKLPLKLTPQVFDYGVEVEATETWSRGRSATLRFSKDGRPSMFNLTSRPEYEGKP